MKWYQTASNSPAQALGIPMDLLNLPTRVLVLMYTFIEQANRARKHGFTVALISVPAFSTFSLPPFFSGRRPNRGMGLILVVSGFHVIEGIPREALFVKEWSTVLIFDMKHENLLQSIWLWTWNVNNYSKMSLMDYYFWRKSQPGGHTIQLDIPTCFYSWIVYVFQM